ncbi:MAG: MFS transporter [Gammaproteobacteria bacterium]|nr:MFS transporter [Gammaproteobacteria bacterium]
MRATTTLSTVTTLSQAPTRKLPPGTDIWFLAIAETIVWAGMLYGFSALLSHWEEDLGWSKTELTMIFSAALAISGLASPLAGKLVDAGHGRIVLAGSALAGAILLTSLAWVHSFIVFAAIWLVLGVMMAGCLYEPCFAYLMHTRGEAARRAITLVTLVAGFAGTLSFPLHTFIAETSGWRTSVVTFGALMAFIAVPLFWIGARQDCGEGGPIITAGKARTRDEALYAALAKPVFWLLAGAFALMYLNHGTVITHLLPLLDERGVQLQQAVLAISLIGPMQVAGRVVLLLVERWVTIHAVSIVSFAALAGASVFLWFGGGYLPAILAMSALQGAAVGLSSITRPVVTKDLLGSASFGAISGAIALPVMCAMAIAPTSGAWLWAAGGYGWVAQFNCFAALAALICYLAAWIIGTRGCRR